MYVCTCRFVAVLCYDIAIDLDDYAFLETDEWCWAQADIQPWYATMLSNGNPRSKKKKRERKVVIFCIYHSTKEEITHKNKYVHTRGKSCQNLNYF